VAGQHKRAIQLVSVEQMMERQLALLALFALLCFSIPQTTARQYWVGRETGVFGLGFIYSSDPVLIPSLAAEFPYNTTAHAWFARIHNDTVTGKLVGTYAKIFRCLLLKLFTRFSPPSQNLAPRSWS
jgi:hypothetical protein